MKKDAALRLDLRRWLALFLLGTVSLLGQAGCVAVVAAGAAGAGVAWVRGTLEANVEQGLDRTYLAAQKALGDLEFGRIDDRKTGVDAQLVTRTALDKRVEIRLEKITPRTTRITIRVGVFGDESLSATILDKIRSNL